MLPILVLSNSYRKQLFDPFILSKSFGEGRYIFIDSARFRDARGARKLYYSFLGFLAKRVVLSDSEGVDILARYPLLQSKKVVFFAWNDNDEVKDWNVALIKSCPRLKIAFLIEEPVAESPHKMGFKSYYFKLPVVQKHVQDQKLENTIYYTSEVEIAPDFLVPQSELDQKIWELSRYFTFEEAMNPQHPALLALKNNRDHVGFHQILWAVRNRMRFNYVKGLKEKFGDRFILVGSDWERAGIQALKSNHDPESRKLNYASSKVCLDLLSKTSSNAHYPRAAEIVSHSDGMLQMRTHDSSLFLGDQVSLRCFSTFPELLKKIEEFMAMDEKLYHELGEKLRNDLRTRSRAHNLSQL